MLRNEKNLEWPQRQLEKNKNKRFFIYPIFLTENLVLPSIKSNIFV
jgi:hypothetical protein